jgi:hypothetical protein
MSITYIAHKHNRNVVLISRNKIADIRHQWHGDYAARARRKKLKWSYDDGDSGSKKCIRGFGGAYGGI